MKYVMYVGGSCLWQKCAQWWMSTQSFNATIEQYKLHVIIAFLYCSTHRPSTESAGSNKLIFIHRPVLDGS